MTTKTRNCQNCKSDFQIAPEDFLFYEKMHVPPPTWCSECRMIRRMVWMNHYALYKRRCDLCAHDGISMFSPEFIGRAYCSTCWWSDTWDAKEQGKEYDFSKSFFEQWRELMLHVPARHLVVHYPTLENSEYVNHAAYLKNCYLVVSTDTNENCAYGDQINNSKECVDCTSTYWSNLCYECFNCQHCYKTYFSVDCSHCNEVWFSKNCNDCSKCIGCVNLRNATYRIFNIQYSKEEYETRKKSLNLCSAKGLEEFRRDAEDFWKRHPVKYYHGTHNETVSGNDIYYSNNALNCFSVIGVEACRYCQFLHQKTTKSSYDYAIWGQNAELMYESIEVGNGCYNSCFSISSEVGLRDSRYTLNCSTSSNLFGCASLRNASYCILNKQYTKKEYEELVPKIIEHMNGVPFVDGSGRTYRYGEFFPPEFSPFAYNESIAQEFFPIEKEDARGRGYPWLVSVPKLRECTAQDALLPDTIDEVSDTITNEVIACSHVQQCNHQCTGAYKITKLELVFYRKMNVPLPQLCPNCRHYQRVAHRNPLHLWYRQCMCQARESGHSHAGRCSVEFETTYAPDRPEIVYCESCYQYEIV